jgi:ubiquinone/menaquinone biosynthesis C-methylase UbiE
VIRVIEEELLDVDAGSPSEVASALRSLQWVNRFFGGSRMHALLFEAIWPRTPEERLDVLEVASGHADALQFALTKCTHRCPAILRIALLDRNAQHLPPPAEWNPALPQPQRIVGDALRIPLPDKSVDVVSCCLFLHHLDEGAALRFLTEALRVARKGVLVNDLERSRAHYALARLWSLVDPSRLSRHDGPVSVRRAYTRMELERLLHQIGHPFSLRRGFLFRLGAIIRAR